MLKQLLANIDNGTRISLYSKVGNVLFHPSADHVIASASADATVRVWDVTQGQERHLIEGHTEVIQSINWNYNGSLIATTCRDKKLRILDVRANQVASASISGCWVVCLG